MPAAHIHIVAALQEVGLAARIVVDNSALQAAGHRSADIAALAAVVPVGPVADTAVADRQVEPVVAGQAEAVVPEQSAEPVVVHSVEYQMLTAERPVVDIHSVQLQKP